MSAKAEPAGKGGAQAAGEGPATALSYEQARDQLTEVVRRLEGGGLTLEQSLDLWERGERLDPGIRRSGRALLKFAATKTAWPPSPITARVPWRHTKPTSPTSIVIN